MVVKTVDVMMKAEQGQILYLNTLNNLLYISSALTFKQKHGRT